MNEVLREFDFAKSFFDDCIIYGNRVNHLDHIGIVLKKFAKLGIHINMAKCQFMKREVIFVGYTVNNTGIRPGESKARELMDFKKPENEKELLTFLGVASYFRKFISGFSETASVLYQLLKKNVPYIWTEDCDKCFNQLQTSLKKADHLCHPDFTKPFVLTTGASNKALHLCKNSIMS